MGMANNIRDIILKLLGNFLAAGCSGLMLALPQLFPELQFIILFALVPFMWKIKKCSLVESICLGSFLALSYALVIIPDFFDLSASVIQQILPLLAAFSLFGLFLNCLKRIRAYNIVLAALIWVSFQYFLWTNTQFNLLFSSKPVGPHSTIKAVSLLILLSISFIMILINSILTTIVDRLYSDNPAMEKTASKINIIFHKRLKLTYKQYNHYRNISPRAPPPPNPCMATG